MDCFWDEPEPDFNELMQFLDTTDSFYETSKPSVLETFVCVVPPETVPPLEITISKIVEQKKAYAVKCYVEGCNKICHVKRDKGCLTALLLGHVYSTHHTLLYDQVKLLTAKKAIQVGMNVRAQCPYGCTKFLQSQTLPRLQRALLLHRCATLVHNSKEFETVREYVSKNAFILKD